MADKTVQANVEAVTPESAEEWLGKNLANRNVRARVVDSYARDMQNGRWQLTGEPIKFSVNGRLLDGQHRLQAVMAAGVPINMLVVRGLPDSRQSVMDSGARRTAGDALRLRGEAHYSAMAAAARLAIVFESGQPLDGRSSSVTHTEILEFVDARPDFREAVNVANHYKHTIDVPPSVLSLAVWMLARIDVEDCNKFIAQIAEKTHMKKGDAILALINRLQEIRRSGRRATGGDYLSLLFRAWNYWRAGKSVDSFPIRKGGAAVNIPEPE